MQTNIQIIDVILFIGICQGVFLSFTLQRITNNNRQANTMLSLLIILATIMLIGRFVYFKFLTLWVFQWSLLVDSIVFLFGPFLYMYLRRLLFVRNNKFQLPWYHYIPFFSLILLAAYFIVFYSPEEYYNLFAEGYMLIIFHVISISMILFNSYYLLRSFKIVSDFKKQEKNVFSFDQSPLTYLYAFLIAFSICLLAWFISLVNSALLDKYFKYVNYESVWVAIPILLYVIGYFSLKQPELFRIPMYPKVNEKKDRLTKMETELLAQKLDSLMLNEQIYLQNDLTLSQVSDLLKTSTNNISWLLNNIYNSTFYDFINGYRIKEFLQKVEKKEHLSHTILALSMDSGFNSKSTFNKAFKREMNDTPSNYIRKRLSA